MRMMRRALLFFFPVLFFSCREKKIIPEEGIVFKNDFESLSGWTNIDTTVLLHGIAHSGNYSALTDTAHRYSAGFIRKLKYISRSVPQKITIRVWTLTKSFDADVALVFSVESAEGKPVMYKT